MTIKAVAFDLGGVLYRDNAQAIGTSGNCSLGSSLRARRSANRALDRRR
jgi:hypothetical protein